LQITKISNEDLQKFLIILKESDIRIPPKGQFCLFWLKEQIKEKLAMAEANQGEVWYDIASRFRYIMDQLDITLIGISNLKEKMLNNVEEIKKKTYTKNNMEIRFERTDNA
jgi:hypothetical protein